MSALDWLHIITPFLISLIVINFLAGIPLKDHTAEFKRTSKVLYICIIASWLLDGFGALLPINSIIAAFLVFLSQITLIPGLILLGVVALGRLLRGGNILSFILSKAAHLIAHILKPFGLLFLLIAPHLPRYISDVLSDYVDSSRKAEEEQEEEEIYKSSMNYRGDFSGKGGINKY